MNTGHLVSSPPLLNKYQKVLPILQESHTLQQKKKTDCPSSFTGGRDLAEWLERLALNVKVETVLGLIPDGRWSSVEYRVQWSALPTVLTAPALRSRKSELPGSGPGSGYFYKIPWKLPFHSIGSFFTWIYACFNNLKGLNLSKMQLSFFYNTAKSVTRHGSR